jgi:hypothetical protein
MMATGGDSPMRKDVWRRFVGIFGSGFECSMSKSSERLRLMGLVLLPVRGVKRPPAGPPRGGRGVPTRGQREEGSSYAASPAVQMAGGCWRWCQ